MSCSLLLLLCSPMALSASGVGEAPPPPIVEERIVVTAGRRQQAEGEVAGDVRIVEGEELAAAPGFTLDVKLGQIPGFSLFRRTDSRVAHPTTQGVSLRGVGPNGAGRTLVLLDGVPLNDPFGGWVAWNRVPQGSVERAEVVQGGLSDLWGHTAAGGVVHLLTAAPSSGAGGGLTANVQAAVGSRGEGQLGFGLGSSEGAWGWTVNAEGFEAGGYFLLLPEQRGAIDEPAVSEAVSLYTKGLGALRSNLTLSLRFNAFRDERGNGTRLTGNETDGALGAVELSGVADLGTRSGGLSWQASLSGHTQDFENLFSSQAADRQNERPALSQFDVPSEALAAAFHAVAAVAAETTLTAGVEARRLEGETNEEFFYTDRFNRRRRAGGEQQFAGLYAQGEWAGERWRVSLGGRLDRWRSRDGERTVLDLNSGTLVEDTPFADRGETEFSPRLSVVYRVGEHTYLRAAAYRAFRAPTVNELFRPFRVRNDITAANALLEPETLTGFEVGVDHQWGSNRRHRARLTLFRSEGDDMVFNRTLGNGPGVVGPCGFVPAGGLCRQRDNLPGSRVQGADGSLRLEPADGWSATLRYLWSDSEGLEDAPLPQVPEHQGSLQIQYRSPRRAWPSILVQLRGADRQFEDDQGSIPLAGYTAVDLGLRFALSDGGPAPGQGGELFLRGENLFDETIEAAKTAEGLITRGTPRTFHGGVRWRW